VFGTWCNYEFGISFPTPTVFGDGALGELIPRRGRLRRPLIVTDAGLLNGCLSQLVVMVRQAKERIGSLGILIKKEDGVARQPAYTGNIVAMGNSHRGGSH
jgi:hypothetical protein